MQRAVGIGEQRAAVAAGATAGAGEHLLAARRGDGVEAARRRRRRGDRELIRLQRGQLARDEIDVAVRDAQAEARLGEGAEAAHLRDGDIAVPVRELAAVAGEGDAVCTPARP